MSSPHIKAESLEQAAINIINEKDLSQKCDLAYKVAHAWFHHQLPLSRHSQKSVYPENPGRPDHVIALSAKKMPKRKVAGHKNRLALLHSLAHIELSAVDMTWDLVARFTRHKMPRLFYDHWVQVGLEEAKHFSMLKKHLQKLGCEYGDFPVHAGLWEAAQSTKDDLKARLAIVPLVLEARGLDVSPTMIAKMEAANDTQSAEIMKIIYRDEKRHVAFGTRWFRYLCEKDGSIAEPCFHRLVRQYFRGGLKPPFNDAARAEAGLTPGFYKPLTSIIG